MFGSEFTKMVKNRRFLFMAAALFFITVPDLVSNWESCVYPPHFISWNWVLHPCKAGFLSGTSQGHIPQIIIFWLLPVILLILGCDSANREKKLGMRTLYIASQGRRRYFAAKLGVSFLVPFITMFLITMVNWIMSIIIFSRGVTFSDLENQITQEMAPYLYFQIQHPYITYFSYILLFCLVVGACGVLCQCLSILFYDTKKVYFVAFIVWILQVSSAPYITNALQPFTETTLSQTVFGILRFLATVIVALGITFMIKSRNKDEI